jgi:hypothetical protein
MDGGLNGNPLVTGSLLVTQLLVFKDIIGSMFFNKEIQMLLEQRAKLFDIELFV